MSFQRNLCTIMTSATQDSNLSSSRNDSGASNSTQSTNTWRLSRASVSSDIRQEGGRNRFSANQRTLHVAEPGFRQSERAACGKTGFPPIRARRLWHVRFSLVYIYEYILMTIVSFISATLWPELDLATAKGRFFAPDLKKKDFGHCT